MKFKTSDIIITKDDFLETLEINPIKIAGIIEDECQKKYGDYYLEGFPMLNTAFETDLTTIDNLGAVKIQVSDAEYYALKDFVELQVRGSQYASKIDHDIYHYCDCSISFRQGIDDHRIYVKLLSGSMRNFIYLGMEIGRFLEASKQEIDENNFKSAGSRRKQ